MDLFKKNAILSLAILALIYAQHSQALECNHSSNLSQVVSKISDPNNGDTYTITAYCRNGFASIIWRKFSNGRVSSMATLFNHKIEKTERIQIDAVLDVKNPQLDSYSLIKSGDQPHLRQHQFITGTSQTIVLNTHDLGRNIESVTLYPGMPFEYSVRSLPSVLRAVSNEGQRLISRDRPKGGIGYSSKSASFVGHYHSETGQAVYFTQDGEAYQKAFAADEIREAPLDPTMLPSGHPLYEKPCEGSLNPT